MSDSLKVVSRLAEMMIELEGEIERDEALLKAKKDRLRTISEVDIPEVMREAGLSEYALSDGSKVRVSDSVRASILDKPRACLWMEDNGFGSLVKVSVETQFKMGESSTASKLYEQLQKKFPERVVMDASVHPSTLKSWMMECLATNRKLPQDLFTADYYSLTKITQPKSQKGK